MQINLLRHCKYYEPLGSLACPDHPGSGWTEDLQNQEQQILF